jgi:hypothetical protein
MLRRYHVVFYSKVALLAAVFGAMLLLALASASTVSAAQSQHGPIFISDNENFTPANGVNGGGSGTQSDPYIIENWVSSNEAVDAVAQFEGWNATELASYSVFTELRYLEEENEWLSIYTVDAKTGNLTFEQLLSLQIPDPVTELRGYYWYVSVDNAGIGYDFWIDAINATVTLASGPYPIWSPTTNAPPTSTTSSTATAPTSTTSTTTPTTMTTAPPTTTTSTTTTTTAPTTTTTPPSEVWTWVAIGIVVLIVIAVVAWALMRRR